MPQTSDYDYTKEAEVSRNISAEDCSKVFKKTKKLVLHDWERDIKNNNLIDYPLFTHLSEISSREVLVCVNREQRQIGDEYDKFLQFGLTSLECTVTQKTFNLEAMVRLGAVSMSHHRVGHETVFIIDTPEGISQVQTTAEIMASKDSEYLITICYCNVDKKCPEFRSSYGSVEQLIELKFTKLKLHLHLQSLQEMMTLLNEYQTRLADIQSTQDRVADAGPLETIMEDPEDILATKSKTSVTKSGSKKTVESIQIKMKAKLGTVEIEFATDLRPLSLVRLQGMRAGVVVKASYTEVNFNIASLYVRDLNINTKHKDILKVVGGDVVNVRVVMFNTEVVPSSEVDMSIDATLNTLRITFLNWFVSAMLDFLNNFQTAQQAIKDASAQAAEAARERAAAAYQNSTKVLLKVRMAAPIIIVPENSQSSKVLIVDLGRLNINNKFIDIKVDDSSKMVTVDELTLELEEMKVSCANIHPEGSLVNERELLKPTTFKLLVKRSLSTWHHALPDLDVSGRIQTITITVGHSDYKSIMRILNQNLTEGQEVAQKSQPASKTVSKTTVKTQASSRVVTKSATAVIEPTKEAKKEETLKATMKFCFTMDKFLINLSTTEELDARDGSEDEDLAQLTLSILSLKGKMFSDGSMHTTLLLVDCTVDDTRPNRGSKIVRYLGRRTRTQDDSSNSSSDTTDKIRSMVDITYTQKNRDTFIDLRVFSFNLILAMDFLNKLAEFASSGLAVDPPETPEEIQVLAPVSSQALEPNTPEEKVKPRKQLSITSDTQTRKESVQPEQSMMTVNIKIEQPDIILVESLEDRSCDAFVLNMECRLKLRQTSERMVAEGGISSLQITARRLDEVLGVEQDAPPAPQPPRQAIHTLLPNVEFITNNSTSVTDGATRDRASPERSRPRYLLAPTHVTLAISQPPGSGMHVDIAITDIKITVSPAISQPPGSGMHVDIAITDIKITVSPDMLALLMRVLATMQSTDESEAQKEQVTLVYHNLWDIRPIKPNAYWFLKTEEATEALEFVGEETALRKPLAGEICMMRSPSIVVSFEMQVGRETVPILVMQASLEGQLKDWSSDVSTALRSPSIVVSRCKWDGRLCLSSSCKPRSRDSSRTGAQM
ncbi:repeating coiled region of VPS13 domain-containing protein [Phthorimaea operculella]|nr:repeating coiled region of VPS13 domain-containing protein [Phthorimaea operculella]